MVPKEAPYIWPYLAMFWVTTSDHPLFIALIPTGHLHGLRLLTRLPKKNVSSESSALQPPSASKRASSVMLCGLAKVTRASDGSKWIYL